jgi:hypothetical protein
VNASGWLLVAAGGVVVCLALVIMMVVNLRSWYRHRHGLDHDDW